MYLKYELSTLKNVQILSNIVSLHQFQKKFPGSQGGGGGQWGPSNPILKQSNLEARV